MAKKWTKGWTHTDKIAEKEERFTYQDKKDRQDKKQDVGHTDNMYCTKGWTYSLIKTRRQTK